eukprot:SAG22_NODE_570_length_9013_cov_4.251739_3_plen_160_part_00
MLARVGEGFHGARELERASDELRGDKEVVLTAMAQAGAALRYAADELRDDKEVVLTARWPRLGAAPPCGHSFKGDLWTKGGQPGAGYGGGGLFGGFGRGGGGFQKGTKLKGKAAVTFSSVELRYSATASCKRTIKCVMTPTVNSPWHIILHGSSPLSAA